MNYTIKKLGKYSLHCLGLVCLFFLAGCSTSSQGDQDGQVPTVIKAGYISYFPGFIVDPNTKEFSGISYDVLQEIAKKNNIQVVYQEEVNRATLVEVVKTDRVDIIASPVWITEPRKQHADFTDPLYYSPVGAYVRADDSRFDVSKDLINDSSVTIAQIEGEGGEVLAKELYPNATLVSYPNSIDLTQMFLEVEGGRADVTFAEPLFAYEYMQNNPGTLKNVAQGQDAVKNWPNAFMIKQGNTQLQDLLNQGINELIADGTLDRIIEKYEPFADAVTRVE